MATAGGSAASWRRLGRVVVPVSIFGLAVAGGAAGVSRLLVGVAARAAGDAGRALSEALPDSRVEAVVAPPLPVEDPETNAEPTRRATPTPPASPREPSPPAPRGFRIREGAVLAAIARGSRPTGTVVTGDAAARGLRLHGVPLPFRDGDVLVSVGGTAATSEDAIVSAVLGAVKHGARTIDGVVLREGEAIPFAVEVPSRFWRKTGARRHSPKRPPSP